MALQAQQIITLAVQKAGAPGFLLQAGQLLNSILGDLCETYDLDVAKATAHCQANKCMSGRPGTP